MSESWHILSVEEVEEKLKTDRREGLSFAEAATRKQIRNDGSVFTFPSLSAKQAARLVMNDVAFYFFFFTVALLFSVFKMWTVAISALVIVAVNCFITVGLKIISNKYENAVLAPSVPRINVRRNGRNISIDGRNAVPGDIVILGEGDILPCDVRIIASKNFSVYEAVELDENGRKRYVRTQKNGETMSVSKGLHINEITNMAFSGGLVTSGEAIGIAVACGKKCYAAGRFNGIEMTSSNRESKTDRMIRKFFSLITNFLFGAAAIFSLVPLLFESSSLPPLDAFSQTFALSVSLPLQTITVLYSTVICCAVRFCARPSDRYGRNSAILKQYSAMSNFDNAGKLFMIGSKSISGEGRCIEAMFVNLNHIVSPLDSNEQGEVKELLEAAFLINKASFDGKEPTRKLSENERLILRSMKEFSIDKTEELDDITALSYKKLPLERGADVAILTNGEDFSKKTFLLCRAVDESIIDCAEWYSSNGADVELDRITRERIKQEYLSLKELGYEVISIARSQSEFYGQSAFIEYASQLVLVGILAIGPSYSRENAASAKALFERGVSVVVCLEDESPDSMAMVKNIFREADYPIEIIKKSDFAEYEFSHEDMQRANAFLGFNPKELAGIISSFKKDGITCASVAIDHADMQAASASDFVIAYSNDKLSENAISNPYPDKVEDSGASASSVKRYASMLVPPVSVVGGGLDGILHALTYVRSFCSNLEKAVSYLISSLIMRMLAVYIPLLFGRPSMNPAMILYLGCFVDLAVILFISCTGFKETKRRKGARSFNSFKDLLAENLSQTVFSAINGIIIAFSGLIMSSENSENMQSYLFFALLITELSTFVYTTLRGMRKISGGDILRALIPAIAMLAFTFLLCLIPGVGGVLGLTGTLSVWVYVGVVSLICVLIGFVGYKDRFFTA